jgi:hypothetical protein
MEAPPHRPGHVGHTPQPVPEMRSDARLLGVFSSSLVRAGLALARPIAAQALPRLQVARRAPTTVTMLQVERHRRLLTERQPWPLVFREGFRPPTAPRSPTREERRS